MKAGGDEDVRRQALVLFSDGEDTSSLISFDEVLELAKRSETAIFTIALRGADTQSKGFHEAEFVMRQLAQETGGRSFFPSKIDDLNGVYAEIADELASQYSSATRRRTPSVTARTAASSSDRPGPTSRRAPSGATTPRHRVERAPAAPVRGRRGRVRDSLRAAGSHRSAARRRRCCCSARSCTPSSSACRRWKCGTCRSANPSRAVSTFVWLLTLSCLYSSSRPTSAPMGVFILPIIVALQVIPVIYPGTESADPVLDSPWFWVHVSSLLFAYASFALAGVLGVTYMLQFKEIKKKHLGYFYTRSPRCRFST